MFETGDIVQYALLAPTKTTTFEITTGTRGVVTAVYSGTPAKIDIEFHKGDHIQFVSWFPAKHVRLVINKLDRLNAGDDVRFKQYSGLDFTKIGEIVKISNDLMSVDVMFENDSSTLVTVNYDNLEKIPKNKTEPTDNTNRPWIVTNSQMEIVSSHDYKADACLSAERECLKHVGKSFYVFEQHFTFMAKPVKPEVIVTRIHKEF